MCVCVCVLKIITFQCSSMLEVGFVWQHCDHSMINKMEGFITVFCLKIITAA